MTVPPPPPPPPPPGAPGGGYPPPLPAPPPPPPSGQPRMGLGDIFDRIFDIYRAHAKTFIVIALASAIPVAILSIIHGIYSPDPGPSGQDVSGSFVAGQLVLVFGTLLLAQFATAGSAVTTVDALHRRTPDAARSLLAVTDRLAPLFVTAILLALGLALGFILLVIPGIILMVLWLFATTVVVTERRGVGQAFSRSAALVKGGFWSTLGMSLVINIVFILALGMVQGALGAILAAALDGTPLVVATSLVAILPSAIIGPLSYIGLTLLYAERCRVTDGRWPEPLPAREA